MINRSIELEATLRLALEMLKDNQHLVADNERHTYVMAYNRVIKRCEEALAQPEQEPVAWGNFKEDGTLVGLSQHQEDQANWVGRKPLYTTPYVATPLPHRKPLTWEQKLKLVSKYQEDELNEYELIEMIEAAHGIKE